MTKNAVIVSACLLGLRTRYNGKDALNIKTIDSLKDRVVIPVCPEQLGGLPTPRPCAEIMNGNGVDVINREANVIDENGKNITANFLRGAEEVLRIMRLIGAKEAVLKEDSPSCGVAFIKRKGKAVKGPGVTTAALKREKFKVTGA